MYLIGKGVCCEEVYRVWVTSEYEYVIEVDDDASWDDVQELAWEEDWTPLIHRADIVEIDEIQE